jgi:hypothetical protein
MIAKEKATISEQELYIEKETQRLDSHERKLLHRQKDLKNQLETLAFLENFAKTAVENFPQVTPHPLGSTPQPDSINNKSILHEVLNQMDKIAYLSLHKPEKS